jgi:hypothetical protein
MCICLAEVRSVRSDLIALLAEIESSDDVDGEDDLGALTARAVLQPAANKLDRLLSGDHGASAVRRATAAIDATQHALTHWWSDQVDSGTPHSGAIDDSRLRPYGHRVISCAEATAGRVCGRRDDSQVILAMMDDPTRAYVARGDAIQNSQWVAAMYGVGPGSTARDEDQDMAAARRDLFDALEDLVAAGLLSRERRPASLTQVPTPH